MDRDRDPDNRRLSYTLNFPKYLAPVSRSHFPYLSFFLLFFSFPTQFLGPRDRDREHDGQRLGATRVAGIRDTTRTLRKIYLTYRFRWYTRRIGRVR